MCSLVEESMAVWIQMCCCPGREEDLNIFTKEQPPVVSTGTVHTGGCLQPEVQGVMAKDSHEAGLAQNCKLK